MMTDIVPTTARLANVQISFKKADGTYTKINYFDQYTKSFTTYKVNQMFTLYTFKQGDILDAQLATELAKVDKVYGIRFESYSVTDQSGDHVNFWFDEIGVLKLGEGQTELLSFDTKDEVDLIWRRWTNQPSVLLPTDAGYPLDKGATTGVLAVPRDGGTGPMHYYLKDRVKLAPGDKIVIKAYVPKVNDETKATFVVQLNRANGHVNDFDYNVGTLEIERGSFQDIVIDVREAMVTAVENGNGDFNTLRIQRTGFVGVDGEQGADAEWYVDSISYIKGDGAIVKLGDTVLSKDAENEITFKANQKVKVVVEPSTAEYTVTADVNNTSVTVSDGVVNTGTKNANNQYVYVKLGEYTYTIKINVECWIDPSIGENVLADFGEKEYLDTIWKNGGTVTYLDGETATAELGEASDGVIKITDCSYNYIKIPFAKPVNLNEISKLYIKLRHNAPDGNYLQFAYLDEEGKPAVNEQYKGNACSDAVSKASVWCGTTTYEHVVDQMTTVEMSMGKNRFHWGTYSPWYHVPEVIDHICIYALRGENVIYVEEIGIIP
jgi:hypothetical protein